MGRENFERIRAPEKFIKRANIEKFSVFPYRTEFDRDRDRILYSKAFRRLKGKTQVFFSAGDDHLRTRLTHTLEVSQIARTISSNLKLDNVLTEAIALGHDIGHTPFGHVGERSLNHIMNNCDTLGNFQNEMKDCDKGFKHNLQSLRVLCDLEKIYGQRGLNLTNFTLWGIKNHTSSIYKRKCESFIQKNIGSEDPACYLRRNPLPCKQLGQLIVEFYSQYDNVFCIENNKCAWSFEGFIVRWADEIAQRHHDFEDALKMGVIDRQEIIQIFEKNLSPFLKRNTKNDQINYSILLLLKNAKNDAEFLPYLSKFIINLYTNSLIESSINNINSFLIDKNIKSRRSFISCYSKLHESDVDNIISFSPDFERRDKEIQDFLRNRILNSYKVQQMDGRGSFIIRKLFKAYITNPRQLHDLTIFSVFRNYDHSFWDKDENNMQLIGELRNDINSAKYKSDPKFQISLLRVICDYISGMTDDFAIIQYKHLYG